MALVPSPDFEPAFEPVRCDDGSYTLRDPLTGQDMHSAVGPAAECEAISLGPSRLRERLAQPGAPLIIDDIGMGMATNALGAIAAAQELARASRLKRGLWVRSYETLPAGLSTALALAQKEPGAIPFLPDYAEAATSVLKTGQWETEAGGRALRWTLTRGDYFDFVGRAEPAADLLFYDFYSPKVTPELWSAERFLRIYHAVATHGSVLCTYSSATHVRLALLAAGFYVGRGPATRRKDETTIAATRREDVEHLLEGTWIEKKAAYSPLYQTAELMKAHPQFAANGL